MNSEIGVTVDWRGATIESLSAVAEEADRLRFETFWVPEAWGLEAFSTLGLLMKLTRHIRLGSGVINVYSRSAASIAMGCVTIDQIGAGRFMLGLGTSGRGLIEKWHSIKFERPFQRLREYVEVIRAIVRGDIANYDGKLLKLSGFRLFTKASASEPEIFLAALGEKSLKLAGEISDGALITLYPISKLRDCAKAIQSGDASRPKRIFAYVPTVVTRSEAESSAANARFRKYVSFYIASMGKYYAQNLSRLGHDEEVKRILSAYAVSGSDGASKAITSEFLEELCLVGSAEEIVEKVSSFPREVFPVLGLNVSLPEELKVSLNTLRSIARLR